MSAENFSWSAIQNAYSDDYERTFSRVANQDAPATRYGEQWVDVLRANLSDELDSLSKYMNEEEREFNATIRELHITDRLTDAEQKFCEAEDAWNASLGLDHSIEIIEKTIAKAKSDVTEIFERGE